jgi:hypothetical protein
MKQKKQAFKIRNVEKMKYSGKINSEYIRMKKPRA